MKMSHEEVTVMSSMHPHEPEYMERWNVQPIKDDETPLLVGTQLQHPVNSDVISMEYMELEEFLMENSVPDGHGKVYIESGNSQLPEKHYHVSLEQRGLLNGSPNGYTDINNGNNNVHLLSIHHHHGAQPQHQQQQQSHLDPNSPPQSSCGDSPPSSHQQLHHSPRNGSGNSQGNNISHMSHVSTARKSLPRRVSTCSSTSSLVVTPPHTPQQPSPSASDGKSETVKSKRAIKRSRKESVPAESKDDKYWRRRAKNNAAAKRSRDLRREKESHIMQRVAFLEKENQILHQEMDSIKIENDELKERLAQYETKTTM